MITTDRVISLYRQFADDLRRVRKQQYWFIRWHYNTLTRRLYRMGLRSYLLHPMLDDLEAEITYLLMRERKPDLVIEMSPNTGWSTTWILSALRDNGGKGQLWSYDLHGTSTKIVPGALASGRWHFVLGDVRATLPTMSDCDYLFMDSDHTREFAIWYVDEVLPNLKRSCIISVHDVFHHATPSEEGEVVMSWLQERGMSYWTPAPSASPGIARQLINERFHLGMTYPVHKRGKDNPMIFFDLETKGSVTERDGMGAEYCR